MKAPFPWFGGKRKIAPEVWAALGDVDNYVRPSRLYRAALPTLYWRAISAIDSVLSVAEAEAIACAICSSVQSAGRPVRFVLLLVDHRISRRLAAHAVTERSWYSRRCLSICSALLTNSKFSIESFSLSPSR